MGAAIKWNGAEYRYEEKLFFKRERLNRFIKQEYWGWIAFSPILISLLTIYMLAFGFEYRIYDFWLLPIIILLLALLLLPLVTLPETMHFALKRLKTEKYKKIFDASCDIR
ncbi:hypothetical protein [Neisseria sp. S1]|uniref:hypothetical protein n=1 Tax=Neisseria sp. S1 TaxID=3318354 RepID=UPI003A848D24